MGSKKPFIYILVSFSILATTYLNCARNGFSLNEDSLALYSLTSSNSKMAGTFDENCLSNSIYDACLFWKSPVSMQGEAFPNVLKTKSNLNGLQIFGVKLKNRLSSNELRSATFNVTASSGNSPVFSNGQLRISYASDGNKYWNAQLMTYFWLNHMEEQFNLRSEKFYSTGQNVQIDAFSSDIANNAYYTYDSNTIRSGSAQSKAGSVDHEMSLDSDIIMHEMGHANFFHASGINSITASNTLYSVQNTAGLYELKDSSQIARSDTILNSYCSSSNGCFDALNEGLADFHYLIIFPEAPGLAQTFSNNTAGMKSSGLYRNPTSNSWHSMSEYYSNSFYDPYLKKQMNGEIHAMGVAYTDLLWTIYTHPKMNKIHFEKIFTEHLKMISTNMGFSEAKDILVTLANSMSTQLDGKNYSSIISDVFSKKGIN